MFPSPLVLLRHHQAVQSQPARRRSRQDGPRDAGSYQRDGLQPGCDWTQHLVMTHQCDTNCSQTLSPAALFIIYHDA